MQCSPRHCCCTSVSAHCSPCNNNSFPTSAGHKASRERGPAFNVHKPCSALLNTIIWVNRTGALPACVTIGLPCKHVNKGFRLQPFDDSYLILSLPLPCKSNAFTVSVDILSLVDKVLLLVQKLCNVTGQCTSTLYINIGLCLTRQAL